MIRYKESPVPDYGDVMTIKEFIAACEANFLTDYDGSGSFCTSKDIMTDVNCHPSLVLGQSIPSEFTHVVWFNK